MPEKLTTRRMVTLIQKGLPADVRDAQAKGLILRVLGPNSWSWCVRRSVRKKDYRLDLGNAWTLDEAREHAAEVDRRVRAGEDPWDEAPALWRRHYDPLLRRKLGLPEPAEPIRMTDRDYVPGPCMTWTDAMKEWLDDVARTRKRKTHADYRQDASHPALRPYHAWFVKGFTRQHAAEVVDEVFRKHGERQAEKVCGVIRVFFGWMANDARVRRSGVEAGRMVGLKPPERSMPSDADMLARSEANLAPGRVPSAAMVGLLARAFSDEDSRFLLRDRLACMLLVYTVQRCESIVSARKREFEDAGDGTGLWSMPPLHRKSAARKVRAGLPVGDHVVPLPAPAWAVVKRAMASNPSEWLFPVTVLDERGEARGPMDAAAINKVFARVPGNVVTPHSMRRALGTTYKKLAGLTLAQVKIVLDHSEGHASGDVTREHYSFDAEVAAKTPIMEGYVAWVNACARLRD